MKAIAISSGWASASAKTLTKSAAVSSGEASRSSAYNIKPIIKLMTATDYTQLHRFLTRKDWKDADIETRQLMLQIAGADSRQDRLLTANDIQNFPCSELKKIDRLWVKASRGRFGFSAVSNLYQAVDEDYFVLADRVGWRSEKDWIDYNKINFTIDAPVGHLPITWLVPTSFWMYWNARFASAGWRLILKRVAECNL